MALATPAAANKERKEKRKNLKELAISLQYLKLENMIHSFLEIHMENPQSGKIYSKNQINIATFLGGPLIAGYLLSQNFKVFGDKDASKKTIIISLLSTIVFFLTLFLLPENIAGRIPKISTAIIPIIVADYIIRKYQSKKIEEYLKKGYKQAASLGVFGKSIISLLITLIILFLLAQTIMFINVKYNYEGYLNNYCNFSYNEKNVPKDKTYVPEDASCFVFEHLKSKGYTHQQVDKVLTLEFEYQKEIGMVSGSNQTISNNSTTYNPLPFIKERQTLALSDEQMNDIIAEEEEYLKLIGVIEDNNN